MNKTLEHLLLTYATQPHLRLKNEIAGLSRDTLESTLVDLLTLYLNDANSSTVREFITLRLAGYQPVEGKLGYNGYRMAAINSTDDRLEKHFCEVKPVNVHHKEDGGLSRRLNGGGNFSDYTPERLAQHLAEPHLQVLVSGFVDGRLVYILEFPFHCLESRLRGLLTERFPDNIRKTNEYLRSASFSFRDYAHCFPTEGRVVYRATSLEPFQDALTRAFFKFLSEL